MAGGIHTKSIKWSTKKAHDMALGTISLLDTVRVLSRMCPAPWSDEEEMERLTYSCRQYPTLKCDWYPGLVIGNDGPIMPSQEVVKEWFNRQFRLALQSGTGQANSNYLAMSLDGPKILSVTIAMMADASLAVGQIRSHLGQVTATEMWLVAGYTSPR